MTDTRFARVKTNGITLHVAEAGRPGDPLLFLLHGFPEYWEAWRGYIEAFAAAGFHVIAPDQRGYNHSDKPADIGAYDLDQLAADILGLADHFRARTFSIVGHDWGGAVGWWLATRHPGRIERAAILNAAHPSVWREAMQENRAQRRKSFYVRLFRLPWLPELLLRRNRYAALAQSLGERHGGVGAAELDRYRAAWAQPGALTAMLNWYRAFLRKDLPFSAVLRIAPPVLLIWGEKDRYGLRELAEASLRLCAEGTARYLPDATHWVQHEKPEQCQAAMLDFLKASPPSTANAVLTRRSSPG